MPARRRPFHNLKTKEFYESSDSDESNDSPVMPRSKAVFKKNLRRMTINGVFTRDQSRQMSIDADQMQHIMSDRFRCQMRDADIIPEAVWQKMQLKFAGDKEAVLDIVQKSHIANDYKKKKGLAKVDYGLREIANHSAAKVRANFNKLLRHIQRFNIKMEQRGALMKILEIPFTSKHEKVMQEARVYIKKVTDFVKQ